MGSITIRALCPRCTKNIPHLVFKKHRLTIECKCNYKGEMSLAEYVKFYNENGNRKCSNNNKCRKHKQQVKFYCEKCEMNLCEKCETDHQAKQDDIFDNMMIIHAKYVNFLKIDVEKMKNYIIKARVFLNEYFPSLIENFRDEELNRAYLDCVSRNKNLLAFIEILITNYNHDNYTMYLNISDFQSLVIYQHIPNVLNPIESLIHYFKHFSFYKMSNYTSICIFERAKEMIKLKNGTLAYFFSKTIKVISPKNKFKCILSITNDKELISLCQLDNEMLVTTSLTKIKIWSMLDTSFKLEHTIPCEDNKCVQVLSLSDNRFVCNCLLDTVKIIIWKGDCFDRPIKEIDYTESKLTIIGGIWYFREGEMLLFHEENCIVLFSLISYQMITKVILGHLIIVNSILVLDSIRLLISIPNENYVYNTERGKIEQKAKFTLNNDNPISCVKLRDNNTILYGNEKGKLFIYDLSKNEVTLIESHLKENLNYFFSIDDSTLISSSLIEGFQIWKY